MLIVDTTEETFFIHQKRQHNGCTFLHTVSHEILIKDRSSTFKQFLLAQTKIHLGKTYRYFLISLHDSSFFMYLLSGYSSHNYERDIKNSSYYCRNISSLNSQYLLHTFWWSLTSMYMFIIDASSSCYMKFINK